MVKNDDTLDSIVLVRFGQFFFHIIAFDLFQGFEKIAEQLIKRGADVNVEIGKFRDTSLIRAASKGGPHNICFALFWSFRHSGGVYLPFSYPFTHRI